ncbi:MAG: protein-tyrosine phosphatase [Flavobacteriales bacterium]|jgi:protein-tyrosine phosphatase
MVRVLFVCLGNICRSPTADGVFRKLVADAGLSDKIGIDSAGTAAWHVGKSPDPRSTEVAAKRHYNLSVLRARQALSEDFHTFDYVLAMDESNVQDLKDIRPDNAKAKLELFLSYSEQKQYSEVPDPYYGDGDGFNLVLDLVEDASIGLLNTIRKSL